MANITLYQHGNPYVNLCLEVLLKDKLANGIMWQDFNEQFGDKKNHEPTSVAAWVALYLYGLLTND